MLHGRLFWISFITGTTLCLLSALYVCGYHMDNFDTYIQNNCIDCVSLYNCWIGGEGMSIEHTLFFQILPFLALLPYGWSLASEQKSGYYKQLVLRIGRRPYLLTKMIVNFIGAGFVAVIPMLINITIVACFIPAVTPTIENVTSYSIVFNNMWSDIYYTLPLLHLILYLVLDFIFAGLFAQLCYAISCFTQNKIAVLLIPYFIILGLQYLDNLSLVKGFTFSPMFFLHPVVEYSQVSSLIVFSEWLILFGTSTLIIWMKNAKYEGI